MACVCLCVRACMLDCNIWHFVIAKFPYERCYIANSISLWICVFCTKNFCFAYLFFFCFRRFQSYTHFTLLHLRYYAQHTNQSGPCNNNIQINVSFHYIFYLLLSFLANTKIGVEKNKKKNDYLFPNWETLILYVNNV